MDGRNISIVVLIVILIAIGITGYSLILKYRGDISNLEDAQSTLQQQMTESVAELDTKTEELQASKVEVVELKTKVSILTDQFDTLTTSATDLETQLANRSADFNSLQDAYFNINEEYDSLKASYDDAIVKLNQLQDLYPLQDYPSYSVLSGWVASHLQPSTDNPQTQFTEALRLVDLGMQQGYWIGIDIEYEPILHTYRVYCNAITGRQLYRFAPDLPNLIATGFYR
jgi:hypothetical protein